MWPPRIMAKLSALECYTATHRIHGDESSIATT